MTMLAGLLASLVLTAGVHDAERPPALSVDVPLGVLMRDPGARAIVARDFPGLEGHPSLQRIEALSLRTIVPNSRGWFTDAELVRAADDLAALAASRRRLPGPPRP